MPTDLGVKSPGQEMAAAVLAGHIDAWALEDNPAAKGRQSPESYTGSCSGLSHTLYPSREKPVRLKKVLASKKNIFFLNHE